MCRCRRTSPRSVRPTTRTAATTRRASRATKAQSRRRPLACISPTISSRGSRRAASACIPLSRTPGWSCPSKVDDTADHKMHAEFGVVTEDTANALNAARRAGGRIVVVGSTSLRLLESAATEDRTIKPFTGETAIFITPGYAFRAADAMLTNFHLPRSTLFMLVSAFSASTPCRPHMRTPSQATTGSTRTATRAFYSGTT